MGIMLIDFTISPQLTQKKQWGVLLMVTIHRKKSYLA